MDQNQKSRITRIQLALENHEWIKAFHLAEASILTNPEILPFRYLMIDALIQGGRFDEAMKRVTDWRKTLGSDRKLNIYTLHLMIYFKKFDEAEALGESLIKDSPNIIEKRDISLHLAFAAHGKADPKKAVLILNDLILEDPLNTDAYETIGKIYFEHARFEEAERYFLQLTDIDPLHPRVHQLLGLLYSEQGKWDEAIMELEEAIEIEPSDETMRELGWTLNMVGDKDGAISVLEEALDMNPMNLQARIDLGSIYMDQENYERAIAEWKIAQKQDPGNSDIKTFLEKAREQVEKDRSVSRH
ncbi:MAG: tetratricopeptide repeat protein [Nitrospirota bacterium]|nr:tetratricopeptide repeat protein [Nitrospirota bacterium]